MTQSDKLVGEQVIATGMIEAANCEYPNNEQMLQAENEAIRLKLADTMRENEWLRSLIMAHNRNIIASPLGQPCICQGIVLDDPK